MPTIKNICDSIIYGNENPALCSKHAYFPSIVAVADAKIVVTMDIGSAFEAIDVRSYSSTSYDEGQTWSEPTQLCEIDSGSHPVSTTCRVGRMKDKSLLGWLCIFDRTRTNYGLVNPDGGGMVRTKFATIRSTDEGHTWSEPSMVDLPVEWNYFETCSAPVQVTNECILVPTSPLRSFEGDESDIPPGIAFVSKDCGESWTETVTIFDDDGDHLIPYEQKMTHLSDGRMLAMCWAYNGSTHKSGANLFTLSEDKGESFGAPCKSPLQGETCTPIGLPGNHVLCIYRRTDRPGLWAHLCRIEGQEWVPLSDLLIWHGVAYNRNAIDKVGMHQMQDLRFGYPSIELLSNGDVQVVFWCVENCVSIIRMSRLNIMI